MAHPIRLKKGLNIPLAGVSAPEIQTAPPLGLISISPDDYIGLLPKVLVKAGDLVQAGTPILTDKLFPELLVVSPVSGVVDSVVRGEKRKLLRILIHADVSQNSVAFPIENPLEMDAQDVRMRIGEAGLWPYIHQRPYDVIAKPNSQPRDIFITGFDSAPLGVDYGFVLTNQEADFQTGLDALSRLTSGDVFLSLSVGCKNKALTEAKNVTVTFFDGPHPAGNVGVQMNHIKPINKGEVVWTLRAPDVLFIGRLFRKGVVDLNQLIALSGPGLRKPCYISTVPGVPIAPLLNGNIHKEMHSRIICGNPLTGTSVAEDGYLMAYANSITVLREGDDVHEFFGWIMPRIDKFSVSRTYLSGFFRTLFPAIKYEPDTRILGGERALIVTGEYDAVFPMDILPEQLVRACITGNIDKQEALGIYEVAPEDLALCEYVCTSKVQVQKVIREALDILRVENGD
jgi:Na+-transporting NADH:ubiquinone oxidoreductase subunit A